MRLNNQMFRQTAPLNEMSEIRIKVKHVGLYTIHVPEDRRENDFSKVFSSVVWRKYRLSSQRRLVWLLMTTASEQSS